MSVRRGISRALAVLMAAGSAWAGQPVWESLPDARHLLANDRHLPAHAHVVLLNSGGMQTLAETLFSDPIPLEIPMPDGSFASFAMTRTHVFHPDLAKKMPGFHSFKGVSDDQTATFGRFDFSNRGFHGVIFTPEGVISIGPHSDLGDSVHVSVWKSDIKLDGPAPRCVSRNLDPDPADEPDASPAVSKQPAETPAAFATRITYRTAISATYGYCSAHGGTTNGALAAIGTTLNVVNGIYERDLGIKLELIADNDLIVFPYEADPFEDNIEVDIDINQGVIDSRIGPSGYDLGHVFTADTLGGGIAEEASACTARKAQGASADLYGGVPAGHPFDVDIVSHEIGHQFDANHCFNAASDGCSGEQRWAPAAYEPGGGQTIMAYGGICGVNDIVLNNLSHFNHFSILQMRQHIAATAGCAGSRTTANTLPVVDAGPDYSIPAQTPFELTASASDADGDTLLYTWEQHDLGPARDWFAPDDGQGPLFRNYVPSESPERRFPANGNLPGTPPDGEQIPATQRWVHFYAVVRDQMTGGTVSDDMTLTVVTNSGPFRVTSQATNGSTLSNLVTVTWDPAGTDLPPVNCGQVDIFLADTTGESQRRLLGGTPNDGSATVVIPAESLSGQRFKVKAHDNVFYDLSDGSFDTAPGDVYADLEIAAVSGPTNVLQGTNATLCVTVRNNGPDTSGGEVVFDWDEAWDPTSSDSATFGDLDAGSTTSLCFMATLLDGATEVTDVMIGVQTLGAIDHVPQNNSNAWIFTRIGGADLQLVDLGKSKAGIVGGDLFTAHVTVSNAGPETARSTLVSLAVSSGMRVEGSRTNLVGDLEVGTSAQTSFAVLASLVASNQQALTATVTGSDPDPVSGNNTGEHLFTPTPNAQAVYSPCFDLLEDGNFEYGSPWPSWTLNESQAYGPGKLICGCELLPENGPFSGSNWVWFSQEAVGGELARLGRTVGMPEAEFGELSFDLWIPQASVPLTDELLVLIGSNEVFCIAEPGETQTNYVNYTVNVSEYCDGSSYPLEFRFISPDGGGLSSFNLDNIQIRVCIERPDLDSDGLPDSWEEVFNLNTNDAFNVFDDPDGDGENNFREWVSGSDPREPASLFKVTGQERTMTPPEGASITVDSVIGRRYQLEQKARMSTTNWTALPVSMRMGTGGPISLHDRATVSNRVYRVRVDIP